MAAAFSASTGPASVVLGGAAMSNARHVNNHLHILFAYR